MLCITVNFFLVVAQAVLPVVLHRLNHIAKALGFASTTVLGASSPPAPCTPQTVLRTTLCIAGLCLSGGAQAYGAAIGFHLSLSAQSRSGSCVAGLGAVLPSRPGFPGTIYRAILRCTLELFGFIAIALIASKHCQSFGPGLGLNSTATGLGASSPL